MIVPRIWSNRALPRATGAIAPSLVVRYITMPPSKSTSDFRTWPLESAHNVAASSGLTLPSSNAVCAILRSGRVDPSPRTHFRDRTGREHDLHHAIDVGNIHLELARLALLHGLPGHALLGRVGTTNVFGPRNRLLLVLIRASHGQLHLAAHRIAVDPQLVVADERAGVEPENLTVGQSRWFHTGAS